MNIHAQGAEFFYGKLGHFFIILSFCFALLSAVSYFLAASTKDILQQQNWIKLGRTSFIIHVFGIISVFVVFYFILLQHQFQYKYVWQHSSKELPFYFVFSAMWAGQEGSTLLWMFWHAILGLVLIFKAKEYESPVLSFMALAQVLLGSMLLGVYIFNYKMGSSPFALLKDTMDIPIFKMNPNYIPEDGTGLNPSLQNYWMVIHPPTLFLGFASTAIPAAYAFASLWKKDFKNWLTAVSPWALFSLMILGAGILMGGAWAYEALNFGGFWAWDPVENASLVPWLLLAAAIHTLMAAKKTGYSLTATYILFFASFILVMYSSFLTKSGVLGDASVHSFTDMGMSGQLLLCIFAFLFPLFGLLIYRLTKKEIPTPEKEEATSSREFWLFIGSLIFALSAMHIIVLTSFPVINKLPFLTKDLAPPSNIKAHYNNVQIWLAIFVAIGSAVTQFFKYKHSDYKQIFKKLLLSFIMAVVVSTIFIIIYKLYKFDYILLLVAAWFSVIANADYILNVLKRKIKFSGGSVTHIGFALMLIGILISNGKQEVISINKYGIDYGSGFSTDEIAENVLLYKDEPELMGKYRVTYLGDSSADNNIYFNVRYEELNKQGKVKKSFVLHPNILMNSKMGNNPVPSTRKTLLSDLYTHVTAVPLKEDGSPSDSISKKTYTVAVGDTIALSNAMAVIAGVNPHATIDSFEMLADDIALGLDIQYVRLDTVAMLEPIYFIRDLMATSIADEYPKDDIKFAVTKLLPETKQFELVVEQKIRKYIIMKAIKFPLINFLWFGIVIMMIGIFISLRKAIQDRKLRHARN
ncbi:MAG: cytochrome c biogenesis protein CcsA [Chitinophagales bacterium]|nr:cytochrome c biogenesis protein CcsA [Chitinophagales bacterium]